MRPVTSTIVVPESRERVFAALDLLADHERFTDHFLLDWSTSGPARGVGARARMRVKKPGRDDWLEMEVIAAEPPRRSVEESVSAGGRRRTRGSYELEATAAGGTRVSFTLTWLEAPLGERLLAPLTRAIARRYNDESLRRFAAALAAGELQGAGAEPEPASEERR